jgi:outer membrane protein OmpA-like peptidoglycan-associated protein
MLGRKRPKSSTRDARILPAPVLQELAMTNSISIAAEAAPRTLPAARFITLAPVLLIAALLVGACAAKTNTGATVAERSFGAGAGAQGTAGEGTASADGGASADGSQGAAGERSSGAGAAAGGRSGDGTAGSAQGDSSLYGDSAADEDSADEFTGIAGDDAASAVGADGSGGGAGGAGPSGRSGSGTSGSSEASLGDDTNIAGQDGTSAGGAAGGSRSAGGAGGAGAEGEMAGAGGGVGGAAGGEGRGASGSAASGADGGGGAGGAGGSRAGQGRAGADGAGGDAVGGAGGSDQEAMVVGMVDAPGSRVRIDEEVTPQTLGGMLPLTVGVDEEGHFDFDQAVLRPEVKSVLDELVVRLGDAEWDRLDIMGYTDRIGTDDYNQQLSERRAWAVARYLVAQGIPVTKMRVEGRGERSSQVAQGECHDLERGELIACLQKDRRVEIEASIRKTEAKIQ